MAAAYILGINMFVALVFAIAFAVVAALNPGVTATRWLAAGYATGIVNVLLEFLLVRQSDPLIVSIGCFLVYLLAMMLCVIGLSLQYRVTPRWRTMAAIFALSALASPWLLGLPYTSPVRTILYQLPYCAMQSIGVWALLKSRRRGALDLLLLAFQVVAAAIYLIRPALAMAVGMAATEQQYMASTYAAISQMLGSVTLIGLALVMLLVLMRDTTAEMSNQSETDALSGVLNRRGFVRHAERVLAVAGHKARPSVLITADLDHFKHVNDTHGHGVGDAVIVHFANVLRTTMGDGAVIGRMGGEEFAVLATGTALADGFALAETARRIFQTSGAAEVGLNQQLTASFGVAAVAPGASLQEAAALADRLLYSAKAGGRNRVEPAAWHAGAAGDVVPINQGRAARAQPIAARSH